MRYIFTKIRFPVLLILPVLLSSCHVQHTYAPALYHHDIAYQPKPASFDSVKTANYFSAGMGMYPDASWSDLVTTGQADLSRAHVFKNVNLSYGVFGAAGNYQADNTGKSPYDFSGKYFGAVGGRISANLFKSYERMDFRYIGFEASYSHEFGAYADFRDFLNEHTSQFNIDPNRELYTLGLTSEIIFHNQNNVNIQHGIRFFLGGSFGANPYSRTDYISQVFTPKPFEIFFPRFSYYLKIHHFFTVIDAGSQFYVRAGVQF